MAKKKWVAAAALVAVALLVAPQFAARWILTAARQRLGLTVDGRISLSWLKPEFVIRDTELSWDNKIKVGDGTLTVSYQPLFFFNPGRIRLKLLGTELKAELLGSWSELQGVKSATLQRVLADIELGPDGIREIYLVDVSSPEFQFQIKQSETLV